MNAMAPLRLHGYFNSSAAYRVRIALALKGLAWESVAVNLRSGEQLGADYGAVNPAHLVPALAHDGCVITQSLAIIDYLDILQPVPRLVPTAPDARTRALEIAGLIGCDIHPLNNLRVLKYLTGDAGLDENARQRWYAHWIRLGFDALESLLPSGAPTPLLRRPRRNASRTIERPEAAGIGGPVQTYGSCARRNFQSAWHTSACQARIKRPARAPIGGRSAGGAGGSALGRYRRTADPACLAPPARRRPSPRA